MSDVRPSGGVGLTSDVWRQSLVRPDVKPFFLKKNFPIFFQKNQRNPFFSLWKQDHSEGEEAQYSPTVHHWWNTQTKQTQQTYRQSMRLLEDNSPKDGRGQIELRGAHLRLVYYNGKQVLCVHSMVHVSWVLHVRNVEDYIRIHHLSIYVYVSYIHTHIYIYIYTLTHTHTYCYIQFLYTNVLFIILYLLCILAN